MKTFRGSFARLPSVVLLTALFSAAPFHAAWAQVAPTLGAAESFAVLGGQTVTNTGPTTSSGISVSARVLRSLVFLRGPDRGSNTRGGCGRASGPE